MKIIMKNYFVTYTLLIISISQVELKHMINFNEKLENKSQTFLYYAYGSNMLADRIHINSPTAIEKDIGKLKNHRLDFNIYSQSWHGAPSTIVPHPGSEVWGVVWEIDMSNLPQLDKQEGVDINMYFAKNITVTTPTGEKLDCRVYQMTRNPDKYVELSDLPSERQPSLVYLNTIIRGAVDHNIPEHYIKFLKSIRHNGYNGEVQLGFPSGESSNLLL